MNSRRLAFLYLPGIALILSLISLTIYIVNDVQIPASIYFLIPIMITLLYFGFKWKVWKD